MCILLYYLAPVFADAAVFHACPKSTYSPLPDDYNWQVLTILHVITINLQRLLDANICTEWAGN